MAPVRRYLRISKYSVLECRIYLDNPSQVQSWLLNPRNPVLPRVIESIRPWVLPKLREEQDRARKKTASKKKGIKDTVVEDDFEVSIFLTETNTRHSILAKHRYMRDDTQTRIRSNTNRLLGQTDDNPVVLQEDDDDDAVLAAIPDVHADTHKRRRDDDEEAEVIDVASEDEDEEDGPAAPPAKRRRDAAEPPDDKKKMAMDVSYEGFAIYGRVLCLVVRPRAGGAGGAGSANKTAAARAARATHAGTGQANMENWITSTQMPVGEEVS